MAGDDSGAGDAADSGTEAAGKLAKGGAEAVKTGIQAGRAAAGDPEAIAQLSKKALKVGVPIVIGGMALLLIAIIGMISFFFGGSAAAASVCTDGGPTSLAVLATNGPVNVGSPYTYPSTPPSQGTISAEMMGYAQTIVRVALQRQPPAPEAAIMIALATALVESKLSNPTVATDHDSLGLFQQRPSQGWGSPAQITDPTYSTNIFLTRLLGLQGWNTIYTPGGAAQKVQGSAHPERYDMVMPTAAGLLQSILPVIQTANTPATTTPVDPNAPTTPTTIPTSAPPISRAAYILGDSITHQLQQDYKNRLGRQGLSVTISAVVGRSWITPGDPSNATGTTGTGKDAAAVDQQKIKEASVIVIALGTNGGLSYNPPDEIVDTIRTYNPQAPIYWVNIAGTDPAVAAYVGPFNQKLEDLDISGKITVAPWAAAVNPGGPGTLDPEGLLSDGIHPSTAGEIKLLDVVEWTIASVQGVDTSKCTGYATGNGGDPSDCPPDTFFNTTTLRISGSAHELCVESVTQARSPAAGKAIIWAFHHVGIPYGRPDGKCSRNTTRIGPDYYDCSGFTTSAYSQTGTNVGGNPTTSTMRTNWPQATRITAEEAKPGDLLLPSTGHVVMLLANGNIIHTSKCGDVSHIRTKYDGGFMAYFSINPTAEVGGGGGGSW